MTLGLLTGDGGVETHMHNMTLAKDAICRFCKDEEEILIRVLCHLEGLTLLHKESNVKGRFQD